MKTALLRATVLALAVLHPLSTQAQDPKDPKDPKDSKDNKPPTECCNNEQQKQKLASILKAIRELEQDFDQKEKECQALQAKFLSQSEDLTRQRDELKQKLDTTTAEREAAQAAQKQSTEMETKLRAEMAKAGQEMTKLSAETSELKKAASDMATKLQEATDRGQEMQKATANLEKQLTGAAMKQAKDSELIEKLEGSLTNQKGEMERTETARKELETRMAG
jgi:chromosome segregation ATPase